MNMAPSTLTCPLPERLQLAARRVEESLDAAETLQEQYLTGALRPRRQPAFWGDIAVRRALIALHRQVSIPEAILICTSLFGPARAAKRSAIGRFWLVLDSLGDAE
jgi:hypothetical protein